MESRKGMLTMAGARYPVTVHRRVSAIQPGRVAACCSLAYDGQVRARSSQLMISVDERTLMTESIEEARSDGGQARKNMYVNCAVTAARVTRAEKNAAAIAFAKRGARRPPIRTDRCHAEAQFAILAEERPYIGRANAAMEERKANMKTKAKATRVLKAELKAMIASAKKKGELEGEDIRRECKEQDEARRLAISCRHKQGENFKAAWCPF
jgi:hypothetical protein